MSARDLRGEGRGWWLSFSIPLFLRVDDTVPLAALQSSKRKRERERERGGGEKGTRDGYVDDDYDVPEERWRREREGGKGWNWREREREERSGGREREGVFFAMGFERRGE